MTKILSRTLIATAFLALFFINGPATTVAQEEKTAQLVISFPTHKLATPDKLVFHGNTYQFNSGTNPTLSRLSGNKPFVVTATYNSSVDSESDIDDYYEITIANITKTELGGGSGRLPNWLTGYAYAPPPAANIFRFLRPRGTFKVTFREQVNQSVLDEVGNYLINKNIISGRHYVGDASCIGDTSGAHVCMTETLTMTATERQIPIVHTLKQVIGGLTGSSIRIEGNVAAPGNLSGFSFSNNKAIAVGGNVNALQGDNKTLANYIVGTQLAWSNIEAKLKAMFDKRVLGTLYANGTFSGTWNLNASGNDPTVSASSSFSTPPEGKLWQVDRSLRFVNGVNFSGRGTIVVDGDVTFTGNGTINCTDGNVGIIASGSIIFDPRIVQIGCGAYTALGINRTGNIEMKQAFSSNGDWTGIFVAKGDILLPRVQNSTLTIKYDAGFANEPTVLYKDLLEIIFSTSS